MRSWKYILPLLASTLCFAAQPDRISGVIDSSQMVTLPGNVHRMAQARYDQGPVEDSLQFGYVTLAVAPSPSQQAALDQLLAQQQDPKSPNYHKWLTPAQYAERFGMSPNDVDKITTWLKSQGLQIVSIGGGRNSVIFSGTAAQIQSAFRTQIHRYNINGEKHIANSVSLSVPAALSGVVTGVRGLNDFRPKPMHVHPVRGGKNGPHPSYTTTIGGQAEYFLAPGDIATMYDLNPLYNGTPAIDGTGQKLAIIGQTDIYLADIASFRLGFGLNPITGCNTGASGLVTSCGTSTTNYLQYVLVPGIADPGAPSTCGDLEEADLDVEWSGATARNAQIIFVNAPATFNSDCTEYTNGGGVNVSLAYAINPPSGPPIADVISMSYGGCEAGSDLPAESLETELQQGNVEGVTIMNSADDIGSAGCDYSPPGATATYTPVPPYEAAQYGLAVSYPASSPSVTAVGGTSIPTTAFTSTYWNSNGTSTTSFGASALTNLIGQEVPWNDDEAFVTFCQDGGNPSFCANGGSATGIPITSAETAQEDIWISQGGGGVSNCYESAGGVCSSGLPQPTWQQKLSIPGLTSPQNTYRFVPDVSLLASPNFPGFIFCTPIEYVANSATYENDTSSSCGSGTAADIETAADGTVSGENFVIYPSIIGGTSASSPIFAGIVALLNQYLNGPSSPGLGNINYMLYSLAATPSNGAFHRITSGDNDVYCQEGTPFGNPSDVICPGSGVMGFSASSADSTTGYNLVSGLGSVDADVLFTMLGSARASTTTAISPPSANVNEGESITLTATVTPSTATGTVSFYNNGSGTALGTASLVSGTATFSTTALPVGTDSVTAYYNGNESANSAPGSGLNSSTSTPAAITVVPADFTITAGSLSSSSVPAGQSAIVTLTITPITGAGTVNFTPSSCSGLPLGAGCSFSNPSVTFGGVPPTGTTTLTISTAANMALPQGAQTITITGTNGSATHTTTVNLTVTATNQTFTIAPTGGTATYSVAAGETAPVGITVTGTNGFVVGTSPNTTTALPLSYTCTGFPPESTCTFSPSSGSSVSQTTLTMNIVTIAPTTQLRPPLGRGSRIFYALMLPGLFGIVLAAGSRFRGARLLGLIVVLGFSTLWLGSCSGGSNSSQNNPGTTPGTYTISVTATTGGAVPLTNSNPPFTITLTVTN
jgi:hypothetical protein